MSDLKIRLREVMQELGIQTPTELAKFCEVSEGLVSQWFSGQTRLGPKPLRAFARTQFSLDWLTDGKLPKYRGIPSPIPSSDEVEDAPTVAATLRQLLVLGRVQAGPDGLLHIDDINADSPEGYVTWWSQCPDAYALRIRGESMSPRYLPGEFVGVDPCAEVLPSDEAIVLLHDGRRLIKRLLWRRDGQICLESVNKNFQNIIIDLDDVAALHLVTGNIPRAAFRTQ